MLRSSLITAAALAVLSGSASAQFNNQWAEFVKDNSKIPTNLVGNGNEVDVASGDLDKNGFLDVVVVRKQDYTSTGKRTNFLLMNNNGTFTSSTLANNSDVGGDSGFATPTNDRDVVIVDVDNDGWLDVITATTLSVGDPKHIGHPRVYMNLGESGGNWLGLQHQDARMPQMFTVGGLAMNPRFCSVVAGDVTGDGYADLFFGDYDSSGAGGSGQPSNQDMNDRLLINGGPGAPGFFTDQTATRTTVAMVKSAFGMAVTMDDYNQDGKLDIMKDTALMSPQNVSILYNGAGGGGTEGIFNDHDVFHTFAPYHINTGDLNMDGRVDVVVSDDGADRYRLNTGTQFNRAVWSSAKTFNFLSGGDDGFASNNLIVDLDNDGWEDIMIADIDVDIPSNARRTHIYHNMGGQFGSSPGTTNTTLREERQNSSSSGGNWIGVVGMDDPELSSTHDFAVDDFDNDGDKDIMIFTNNDQDYWLNQLDPIAPVTCQTDLGGASGPGALTVCGGDLSTGTTANLELTGAAPFSSTLLFAGFSYNPTPVFELGGASLTPLPAFLVLSLPTNAAGGHTIPIPGGMGPLTVYMQEILVTGLSVTNTVQVDILP